MYTIFGDPFTWFEWFVTEWYVSAYDGKEFPAPKNVKNGSFYDEIWATENTASTSIYYIWLSQPKPK